TSVPCEHGAGAGGIAVPVDFAFAIVRCWSVILVMVFLKSPPSKWKIRVALPPSSVILPPPSIVVSLPFGSSFWDEIEIVAGPPQSNVMTPPFAMASENACSVQLAAEPVPTLVVGWETSSGWMGQEQTIGVGPPPPMPLLELPLPGPLLELWPGP